MGGPLYMVGTSSGSYFPSTPEPSSPTESASLKPNDDSPLQPHDNPEQNADPFVTPLETELEDNLQSEMIELDRITGSREPSPSTAGPSVLDLPRDDPSGDHNSRVETNISLDDTAQQVTGEEDRIEEEDTGERYLKPALQHGNVYIQEPCPANWVSDEAVVEGGGNRKDANVGASGPVTGDDCGRLPLEPSAEGECRVSSSVPAGGRDDVQKIYKRQRRSVMKN